MYPYKYKIYNNNNIYIFIYLLPISIVDTMLLKHTIQ